MRKVVRFMGCYVALSFSTLGAIVALRDTHYVTDAVGVRASLVALASLISLHLSVRALRGSRGALLRLRIVTAIMLVAIVVIAALPGMFPLWFRLEQVACGLLLLTPVIRINRKPALA
ncbi:membrane protein [Actinoplanes sp. SE50]|nr:MULTISPECIES: hypothetical protein [unclassified Actinoplanes]AEV83243.1 hypothetical protein ACPL_2348 [Actinoplanes sp. SE50/110]ATO81636.1 membrane protein [Actinoplanes sp. SE50]SLL99044.1 hypothetical protein ACSP50_2272 [Actinoplanes sp. SE50/110]